MLLLDVGNSRIKWKLHGSKLLSTSGAVLYDTEMLKEQMQAWFGDMPVQERVVICAVVASDVRLLIANWFTQHWQCTVDFVESAKYLAGVRNGYSNEAELGVDRWMAIVAAFDTYAQAVCVIDCGTAITLDVVDESGQHQGGMIMPGLKLMRDALVQGAAAIEEGQGQCLGLAKNTADGVFGGCLGLAVSGLAGIYQQLVVEYGEGLKCVVTGGDGALVAGQMDCGCDYNEDLVLQGLIIAAQE